MLRLRWRRFWPIRVKSTDYSRGFQVGYDEGFHEADRLYAANWAIYRHHDEQRSPLMTPRSVQVRFVENTAVFYTEGKYLVFISDEHEGKLSHE